MRSAAVVPRVAVIGAGLSGLCCARLLKQTTDASITVLEKSASLGGRCATKRWRGSVVDHGAQYFTVETPAVRHLLWEEMPTLRDDIRVIPADAIVVHGDVEAVLRPERGERYYCASGNSAIGKALAEGLIVKHGATVRSVTATGKVEYESRDGGELKCEAFDAVVVTAPLPQSEQLLSLERPGGDVWKHAFSPNLTAIFEYDSARVGSNSLVHSRLIGSRIYAQRGSGSSGIGPMWSACENAKSGRIIAPGRTLMVVQASDEYSDAHIDSPTELWLSALQREVERVWSISDGALVESFPKVWRYARVRARDEPCTVDPDLEKTGLFLCGDGVAGSSRVETAMLHGITVANQVVNFLNNRN